MLNLLLPILLLVLLALRIYGAYLAFKKKWWLGLLALIIPGISDIIIIIDWLDKRKKNESKSNGIK